MHLTIGIKIFGIAVGLLILMAVVALLSMRMTRTVDDQLVIIDHNYFPAYVALAEANIRSVEESAFVRRQLLALAEPTNNAPKVEDLHQRIATAGKASDEEVAAARQHINEQIADPLDFDDNVALARLDVRIWRLASDRGYEIQIDDMGFNVDTGQNFSPLHQTGAVYALAPSSTLASKPAGQWNTFEDR
jgi:adenylate cyclase